MGIAYQIDSLITRRHFQRQGINPDLRDENRKKPFPELLREQEFGETPFGREPVRCHQEQDSLTPISCRLQCVLPALTGEESLLSINVQKYIVPSVRSEPLLHGDGLVVILAGVTYEYA